MVAAAKLKRATEQAESARPYAQRMSAVIANLARGVSGDGAPKLLAGTGHERKHLIVVATADKGLAGGFNTSIVRAARERIQFLISEGKDIAIITVGRKANDQLRRLYGDRITAAFTLAEHKVLSLAAAQPVADRILSEFEAGNADVVTLFYSRFKSVISQVPTAKQLIPAVVDDETAPADLGGAAYEYEPSEEAILETLLPRNLTVQVLRALLENAASEQGARMSAMDSATRNAGEMIKKQTTIYNRSRQAMITKELIEIISGAEAL